MYIMDSNQYAIELVTYLLALVVYFYELIVYAMLLEINAFDSIAFFSQCTFQYPVFPLCLFVNVTDLSVNIKESFIKLTFCSLNPKQ